jgi:hypothetical protein
VSQSQALSVLEPGAVRGSEPGTVSVPESRAVNAGAVSVLKPGYVSVPQPGVVRVLSWLTGAVMSLVGGTLSPTRAGGNPTAARSGPAGCPAPGRGP